MFPMDCAPKDKTRILILHTPLKFDFRMHNYVRCGTKWEEGWWCEEENGTHAHWQPWEGSYQTRSTGHLENPIGWLPRPDICE